MVRAKQTIETDVAAYDPANPARVSPYLFLVLDCDRPATGSSRHALAGLDRVAIGRAERRQFTRAIRDGVRELELGIPDKRISSTHARLVRDGNRWLLHDTGSRNGVLVRGARVMRHQLRDRDVFILGHTAFMFRVDLPVSSHDPPDVDSDAPGFQPSDIVTLSPAFASQLERVAQLATTTIPLLVHGESGVGKEVMARSIHRLSGRSGELVAANCAAIPANLIEAELFGATKGAYSGATHERVGLIRTAHGGTLFLDEVGDLPLRAQAALLRVLQEREVRPVGGTRPIAVDLRLISATHRDLTAMVQTGVFREDLLARIKGYRITVPALRERPEDLGLLIRSLLQRHLPATRSVRIHPTAADRLLGHQFPLNVRELDQALSVAVALATDDVIASEHLALEDDGADAPDGAPERPSGVEFDEADLERRAWLRELLGQHRGNVSAVAREAGKGRTQIQRWMKRYGLVSADFR